MIINFPHLVDLVETGYVSRRPHPTLPLNIYNYTAKAAYEKDWNNVTLLARGLVLDHYGAIVAHPLKKFFNMEELTTLPRGKFRIYEKLDGSYVQFFWYKDQWVCSSRGSFDSDQTKWANDLLGSRVLNMDTTYNYICELIHPENRIVCNYGDRKELVLLAKIDRFGNEANIYDEVMDWVTPAVWDLKDFEKTKSVLELKTLIPPDEEGYVIHYDSGYRFKIKSAEYVKLHKFISNTTTINVWEALKDKKNLYDRLSGVPDELYDWYTRQVGKLYIEYMRCVHEFQAEWNSGEAQGLYEDLGNTVIYDNRAKIAKYFKGCKYTAALFHRLKCGDYMGMLWEYCKPEKIKMTNLNR